MGQNSGLPRERFFYGWVIVAGCFLVTTVIGEAFSSFGIFFKSLEDEFGWNRAETSTAYSAFLLGYAISSILTGRLSDRYNPRTVLLVCTIVASAGMGLAYFTRDLNQLRAFLFIMGTGAGATWAVPTSVVQKWFWGRRGAAMALSIVSCGAGIGIMVFAPLTSYLVLTYGWRMAYLILGITFLVITGGASLLIKPNNRISTIAKSMRGGLINREMVSTSYIVIVYATMVSVFVFQTVSVHLVPFATDAAISIAVAALGMGLIGGLSIPSRLLSGIIAGKAGWRSLFAISLLGMGLSMAFLIFVKNSLLFYIFIAVFGFCQGFRITAQVGILGEYFGIASLGQLIGAASAVSQGLAVFSPYLAGYIFDTTGSYSIAFAICAVLLFSASLVLFLFKRPAPAREEALYKSSV